MGESRTTFQSHPLGGIMKSISLCLLVISGMSAFAHTVALEDFAAHQQIVKFSPVTMNGMSLTSGAKVCAAMGFARFVEEETEPCAVGETLGGFINELGNIFGTMGAYQFVDKGLCKQGYTRLKSVTCAK